MTNVDTIYALSSGALPSGVAVVRLSGSMVCQILEALCGDIPKPRVAELRSIRCQNKCLIDRGLVLYFPSPHSFTGEDCAEFHLHGGRAVISACFDALTQFPNCRLAEAGEFSKRAFDNGKMDLTSAEGLADLIAAETQSQLSLALEQSGGGLKDLYQSWTRRILKNRALIEAELDFSDEEDIPGSVSDEVWRDIEGLVVDIKQHLAAARIGEASRNGFSVVIIGSPNVGKSTLLNRLSGRDVAIVSSEAGTTRDVLEVRLNIDGYLVILKDTAGLRSTSSEVEREGIRRAEKELESADLVLHLVGPGESENDLKILNTNLPAKRIVVYTKSDLLNQNIDDAHDFHISAKDNVGIDALIDQLGTEVLNALNIDDMLVPTRRRYVELLRTSVVDLELALNSSSHDLEIRAEYLRQAQIAIGRITGQVDVEDLLGVIFSEFCVGK